MAILSDRDLFTSRLPASYRPILDQLAALDRIASAPNPDRTTQLKEMAAVRRELLNTTASATDDLPASLAPSSATYRQWFTEAVLLWPHFADAVGNAHLNTLPGTTIVDYPVDLPATTADTTALRRALIRMFNWTEAELQAIEDRLARLTANLEIKKAITQSVLHFMGADAAHHPARAVELMRNLYPPLPWRPGDVGVVVTTAGIFLCLPYEGESLTRPDWPSRPAAEREAIAAFVKRVHDDAQRLDKVRFPAFGTFDPADVDTGFLDRLVEDVDRTVKDVGRMAGRAGPSRATVADTLNTMVTILPTSEVDQFLIHDAAGHGWQETLCEFEWLFRELPHIAEPANLHSAFAVQEGCTVVLNEKLLERVEADLRQRMKIGINVVVSESLADIVENKLRRCGHPLPSSSLLPEAVLKLDLSLQDARRMIRNWSRPYRHMIQDRDARASLYGKLTSEGFPTAGLEEAINEAAQSIETHFGSAFETTLPLTMPLTTEAGGPVRANLLQRIMVSMATYDRAADRFLAAADRHAAERGALPVWRTPVASVDLLVLLLGWFYEQERALHAWHMDELLNDALAGTLLQLEQALDAEFSR